MALFSLLCTWRNSHFFWPDALVTLITTSHQNFYFKKIISNKLTIVIKSLSCTDRFLLHSEACLRFCDKVQTRDCIFNKHYLSDSWKRSVPGNSN